MNKIKNMIASCPEIMDILAIIKSVGLEDSWLCAGTLRNFVWNQLSNNANEQTTDVDLVFYDPHLSYQETLELEKEIKTKFPQYDWEVKNEVYMHVHTPNAQPYLNACDAIAKFPEKCTAIAARLDPENCLEVFLPYGESDILEFKVSPTPFYQEDTQRHKVYNQRMLKKNWQKSWSQLEINYFSE
ncbi:nucleotidyltransferase family protein [Streptococcus parauberis]|uniref:nucleotidyltransferase family protein n=1 Tax=Streptococcus parauberis TaxID=1348 RepID=UPI000CCE5213|nr:nucleotidyltransferase family protein [Streptococcus parauberis]PNY18204.1 hypothetical protein ASN86_02140 [Streptococcus parauberis]